MSFTFREDGWFNMTKAAKVFGKQLSHFWRSPDTQEYIYRQAAHLGKSTESVDSPAVLYFAQRGYNGGTWAHPKLAIRFARWLSVDFEIWCDKAIEEILNTGMYVSPSLAEQAVQDPDAFIAKALMLADMCHRCSA